MKFSDRTLTQTGIAILIEKNLGMRCTPFIESKVKGERGKSSGHVKVSVEYVINLIVEAGTDGNKFH